MRSHLRSPRRQILGKGIWTHRVLPRTVMHHGTSLLSSCFLQTIHKSAKQKARNEYFHFSESTVLRRAMQCCALNGGVFLASIIIFEYGLLPLVKYLLTIIFDHSPGMDLAVWSWIQPFLSLTFSTIWVLPLFLLSRIVNSLWFQVWFFMKH